MTEKRHNPLASLVQQMAGQDVTACYQCGKCTAGCPMTTFMDLTPNQVMRLVQRGGGYDRNIWSIRELYEKIDYIHANPVRRGLVEHPGDWPWSSWRAWHEDSDSPIRIDRESLPPWESPDGLPRH